MRRHRLFYFEKQIGNYNKGHHDMENKMQALKKHSEECF